MPGIFTLPAQRFCSDLFPSGRHRHKENILEMWWWGMHLYICHTKQVFSSWNSNCRTNVCIENEVLKGICCAFDHPLFINANLTQFSLDWCLGVKQLPPRLLIVQRLGRPLLFCRAHVRFPDRDGLSARYVSRQRWTERTLSFQTEMDWAHVRFPDRDGLSAH